MSEIDTQTKEAYQAAYDLNDSIIDQLQKAFEACEDETSKEAKKILKDQEYLTDVNENIKKFLDDEITSKQLKKNVRRLNFNKNKKYWIGGGIAAVVVAAIAAFLRFGNDEEIESVEVIEEA